MAVNRISTGNLQIFSRPFSSQVTGHCQQPLIHSLLIYPSLISQHTPHTRVRTHSHCPLPSTHIRTHTIMSAETTQIFSNNKLHIHTGKIHYIHCCKLECDAAANIFTYNLSITNEFYLTKSLPFARIPARISLAFFSSSSAHTP